MKLHKLVALIADFFVWLIRSGDSFAVKPKLAWNLLYSPGCIAQTCCSPTSASWAWRLKHVLPHLTPILFLRVV